ncbi:MAG: ComEC/Rec2 family competence protein [Blautia sp.]|jgi:competence protein ComEC
MKWKIKKCIRFLCTAALIVLGLFVLLNEKPPHTGTASEDTPGVTASATPTKAPVVTPSQKPASTKNSKHMKIHVLNVGQGLSVLIESQGHAMLYDGGGPEKAEKVTAYLKKKGIQSLDYLVASHYDYDHLYGLVLAAEEFPTDAVWGPDDTEDTYTYRNFLKVLDQKGRELVHPKAGTSYSLGAAMIEILGPQKAYEDHNNCSLVIKISCEGASVLLTGDAASLSENDMLESGVDLSADILVAAHHGSSASTSKEFLEAVSPAYAVISCGADNPFGHPAWSVMNRLKKEGILLYRTDLQGLVTAVCTKDGISWNQEPCTDYSGRIPTTITPKATDAAA